MAMGDWRSFEQLKREASLKSQITPPTSRDELERRIRKYRKPQTDWLLWFFFGAGAGLAVLLTWQFMQDEILCKKRSGFLISTRISWVCIRKDALIDLDKPEMKMERVIP